ncbi:MAG: hypothetical protein HOJ54_09925 [Phycisphaerae bacterium]|nr:hypothetical protein [Phycisphaerae bacterium]
MTQATQKHFLPGPLALLNTIWFGITLMTALFVYCSIGSAGIPLSIEIWEPGTWYPLRESRFFEMTEYEWFNWWPFFTLMGLLCVNMAIVTICRIPLTAVHAGVWMIHAGIIVMTIGCVIYFGTKVEGDVAVARGRLHITVPGYDALEMRAMPGAQTMVGTAGDVWSFRVTNIDPEWSLLSGDDAGKQTYAVTIAVEGPDESFMRQVIAGYPEYTEDIVPSGNHNQPMARAKKVLGTPLVNEELSITIGPDQQDTFYLQAHSSIYLREVVIDEFGRAHPVTKWIERPLDGLPRFNDRIGAPGRVWSAAGESPIVDGISIRVPARAEQDPLAGNELVVSDYVRYAVMQPRPVPVNDGTHATWARATLNTPDGRSQTHDVFAADPTQSTAPADKMDITWVSDDTDIEASVVPRLQFSIPAAGVDITVPIEAVSEVNPDLTMTQIEGTPFSWRVQRFDDDLFIAGQTISMARVEISDGDTTWLRWVFDDPTRNADMGLDGDASHDGAGTPDDRILTTYVPPTIGNANLMLLAGPQSDQLRLRIALPSKNPRTVAVLVGEPINLTAGITLTVDDWAPSVQLETKPAIIPLYQRDRAAANQFSMVRVVVPGQSDRSAWLPLHHYPFESANESILGFRYSPTMVELEDGRLLEMMFSRRSHPLTATVSLDGFEIASHVGGFTGSVSSVLNWHSNVRFEDKSGTLKSAEVSVNAPTEHDGLWFFQSQWDPPDPGGTRGGVPSRGRNFTVLGVGNRNGVWMMLAGCVLSVIGMIYAFYVKPMIKRRAALGVYSNAEVAS